MFPVSGIILFFNTSRLLAGTPEPFPKNLYVFSEKHFRVFGKTCTSFSSVVYRPFPFAAPDLTLIIVKSILLISKKHYICKQFIINL